MFIIIKGSAWFRLLVPWANDELSITSAQALDEDSFQRALYVWETQSTQLQYVDEALSFFGLNEDAWQPSFGWQQPWAPSILLGNQDELAQAAAILGLDEDLWLPLVPWQPQPITVVFWDGADNIVPLPVLDEDNWQLPLTWQPQQAPLVQYDNDAWIASLGVNEDNWQPAIIWTTPWNAWQVWLDEEIVPIISFGLIDDEWQLPRGWLEKWQASSWIDDSDLPLAILVDEYAWQPSVAWSVSWSVTACIWASDDLSFPAPLLGVDDSDNWAIAFSWSFAYDRFQLWLIDEWVPSLGIDDSDTTYYIPKWPSNYVLNVFLEPAEWIVFIPSTEIRIWRGHLGGFFHHSSGV